MRYTFALFCFWGLTIVYAICNSYIWDYKPCGLALISAIVTSQNYGTFGS